MTLTVHDRRSISRMVGLGVPMLEIADEFGIRVRDVERIDRFEMSRQRPRAMIPAPQPRDWKSAWPASDLYRPSDSCKWPVGHPGEPDFHFCGAVRLKGYAYCGEHRDRAYRFQARAS